MPIRVIRQTAWGECGAVALAMVLNYLLGCEVSVATVARQLGTPSAGTTAARLLSLARSHGLRAKGVAIVPDSIGMLPSGSILHWNASHFVVLVKSTRHYVHIIDPLSGHRRLGPRRFARYFSGVALVFEVRKGGRPRARRPV